MQWTVPRIRAVSNLDAFGAMEIQEFAESMGYRQTNSAVRVLNMLQAVGVVRVKRNYNSRSVVGAELTEHGKVIAWKMRLIMRSEKWPTREEFIKQLNSSVRV